MSAKPLRKKKRVFLETYLEHETDYRLKGLSAWITVNGFSVYIKREESGVSVDLFEVELEGLEPISSATATHEHQSTPNGCEKTCKACKAMSTFK